VSLTINLLNPREDAMTTTSHAPTTVTPPLAAPVYLKRFLAALLRSLSAWQA
jgi:hypothetical protein